jgi:hypothetical protein
MFYREYVRVGRHIRVGYFLYPFKRPFWIGRKAPWYVSLVD